MADTKEMELFSNEERLFRKVRDEINRYQSDKIPIGWLAEVFCVDFRTLERRVNETEVSVYAQKGGYRSFTTKDSAYSLALLHKPMIMGWKTAREVAQELGTDARILKYLIRNGRIMGEKDICGVVRISSSEKEKAKEICDSMAMGMIMRGGEKYYSINKTAKDAASLITAPQSDEFKIEVKRLNKRFQRQVHEKSLGQINFDGRCYVPSNIYEEMIKISTLSKGKRTFTKSLSAKANRAQTILRTRAGEVYPIGIGSKSSGRNTAHFEEKVFASNEENKPKDKNAQNEITSLPKTYSTSPNKSLGISAPLIPPKNRADPSAPPINYNPNMPPLLEQCKMGRKVIFYERTGVIEGYVLGDPFRPQIQVFFPSERDNNLSKMNLLIRSGRL